MGLLQDGIEEWRTLPRWGKIAVLAALGGLVVFVYLHRKATGTTLGLTSPGTGGITSTNGPTDPGVLSSPSNPPDNTFAPDPGAWIWPTPTGTPGGSPPAAPAPADTPVTPSPAASGGPFADLTGTVYQQFRAAEHASESMMPPPIPAPVNTPALQQFRASEHANWGTPPPAPAPIVDTWWTEPATYTAALAPAPAPAPAPVYQRGNQRYS